MPGRRNSRLIGVAIVLAIVLGGAVSWFWFFRSSEHFRTATPLDVASYASSAKSLRGNLYRLEGEVLTVLAWSPSGRLISVGTDEPKKAVPILLPSEFNPIDIQKGLRFHFLLTVDDQGVLRVKKLVKA